MFIIETVGEEKATSTPFLRDRQQEHQFSPSQSLFQTQKFSKVVLY